MTSTEEKITLEQMPQLLVELKGEILGIKEMIAALGGSENSTADQWMDLDAFRAYHPDKPARDAFAAKEVCINHPHATDAVIAELTGRRASSVPVPAGRRLVPCTDLV